MDRTLNLDVEDVYTIVNVLRDSCGCTDCRTLSNEILRQLREQK